MTLSNGFRKLASTLEDLETNGVQVLDVATVEGEPRERLMVDLTVAVSLDGCETTGDSSRSDRDERPAVTSDGARRAKTGRRGHDDPARSLDTAPVEHARSNDGGSTDQSAVQQLDKETTATRATGDSGEVVNHQSNVAREAGMDEPASPGDGPQQDSNPQQDPKPDTETEDTDGGTDVVHCPVGECDQTFESEHGMKIHRTKVHLNDGATTLNDGLPAYRDPERLRAVFESCDSFEEMRKALQTDVSTQTVRRQTIAHGIYDPEPIEDDAGDENAVDESADDEDVGSVVRDETDDERDDEGRHADDGEDRDDEELDAIELPEGVRAADLRAAVSEAKTLYDVQQRFDLERDAAMQLLEKYDLLGIVHGRVSNRDVRKDVDDDEITRRILEHVPGAQPQKA